MGFKPVPMARMRIIAYREKAAGLLTLLHDMKSIQFEDVTDSYKEGMKSSTEIEGRGRVIELMNEIRGMENLLPPRKITGKRKFSNVQEIISAAEAIRIGEDLRTAVNSINDLKTELKSIDNRLEIVEPLESLDADMSCFNNSVISSYLIQGEYEGKIGENYIVNRVNGNTVLSMPKSGEKEFAQSIGSQSGKAIYIMQMRGKPREIRDDLLNLKKNINEKISELETGIGELSDKHYSEIVSVREALEIEAGDFPFP